MNITRKIAAVVLAASVLLCGTACSNNDGSGAVLKYDIGANPQTLDPQSAGDSISEQIIASMYMGLLTLMPDGSLGEGVAQDYSVSDDGLTYTFTLNENVWWTDMNGYEQQCTAHDFVYGFQRLFKPETKAPRASEYYCIKRSELINRGLIPDMSELGVRAVSDFVLEINLEYPNPRFLQLLTEAPAMPCSEEYFIQSQGKYGLAPEATPSNGAFYVSAWAYDPYTKTDNNHLILRRNSKNNEYRRVYPSGLNFFIVDESKFTSSFTSGVTSCISVSDAQAVSFDDEDYTVTRYSNTTVGLLFNCKYPLFEKSEVRSAMAALVERSEISGALSHYDIADCLVPLEVSLLEKCYREYAGIGFCIPYDAEKASAQFAAATSDIDREYLMGARIILTDDAQAQAVSYIMQQWQRELGVYCKIEQLSSAEMEQRLQSGDFEIAVTGITGAYNSPAAYLEVFSKQSAANYGSYHNAELERMLKNAEKAVDLASSTDTYVEAEKLLLADGAFVPLYYRNEYFFLGEDIADITYNPFTNIVNFTQGKEF